MNLLTKATNLLMRRMDNIEHKAGSLFRELEPLQIRLARAYNATLIDALVVCLAEERRQMAAKETNAESISGVAKLGLLGIHKVVSWVKGQKSNGRKAIPGAFIDEPFGDIRAVISEGRLEVMNISKMAREQNTSVTQVIASLEKEGNQVFTWPDFEARAREARKAALEGQLIFEGGGRTLVPSHSDKNL